MANGALASGNEFAGSDIDLVVIELLPATAQLLEALLPARDQLGRAVKYSYSTPFSAHNRCK